MNKNVQFNFLFSKMTEIWWIFVLALKSLKHLPFDWTLSCKVYNIWPKKSTEALSFKTLKSHAKFEGKLTCGLENDMRNFTNFHQATWKFQKSYFHGILLPKVKNAWTRNLTRSCVMTLKNDKKSEEELTCRIKIDIRNLTNFDSSNRKFQKFTL